MRHPNLSRSHHRARFSSNWTATEATAELAPAVRSLDALHLATCDYLHRRGPSIELASYDQRMNSASRATGLHLFDFGDAEP